MNWKWLNLLAFMLCGIASVLAFKQANYILCVVNALLCIINGYLFFALGNETKGGTNGRIDTEKLHSGTIQPMVGRTRSKVSKGRKDKGGTLGSL